MQRLNRGRIAIYLLVLLAGLIAGLLTGERVMQQVVPVAQRFFPPVGQQDAPPDTPREPAGEPGGGVEPGTRQEQIQADLLFSRRNAIVRATRAVTPSVVGIVVTRIQVVQSQYQSNDFFDLFFGPQTVPRVKKVDNIGSGFVFRPNGMIMTNYHVVEGARKVFVNFSDGRQMEASIVGVDPQSDIAVLKAAATIPPLELGNSDELMIGEWAIAVGNPFLNFLNDAQPTVTVGVVSALNRNFSSGDGAYYRGMIQTDAAINPGNSGGPLLDALGRVIGINTVIYTGDGQGGAKGWVGIGFAIPVNRARRVVDELVRHGRRRPVWTGISAQELNRSIALALGYERNEGVVVVSAIKGSPGDRAGLQRGDVIVRIGPELIRTSADLEAAFIDFFVGDNVTVRFVRGGKEQRTTIRLEELPPQR